MPSRRSAPKRRAQPTSVSHPPVKRTSQIWRRSLSSASETDRLGRVIGSMLEGGEALALSGALGAGKTALVRGIAAGLGAPPGAVTSPTFVLLHEYRGRLPLVHLDLYRLASPKEADSIGLCDYLSGQTVVAVEWAEKAPRLLPRDRLEMELRHRTVQSRSIHFKATGPLSTTLLARIKKRSSLTLKGKSSA